MTRYNLQALYDIQQQNRTSISIFEKLRMTVNTCFSQPAAATGLGRSETLPQHQHTEKTI